MISNQVQRSRDTPLGTKKRIFSQTDASDREERWKLDSYGDR